MEPHTNDQAPSEMLMGRVGGDEGRSVPGECSCGVTSVLHEVFLEIRRINCIAIRVAGGRRRRTEHLGELAVKNDHTFRHGLPFGGIGV